MTTETMRLSHEVSVFLDPLATAIRKMPWEDARKAAESLYVIARDYMKVPEDWEVMVGLRIICGARR